MFSGLSAYTWMHTALSLVGLASGFIVLLGLLASKRFDGWTALYFVSTIATHATGFGFSYDKFEASHWIGGVSLVVLTMAILARYVFQLAGAARGIYPAGVTLSLYFSVFIAIAQAFKRVPALKTMVPSWSEPWFAFAQLAALALFAALGIAATLRFRPQ